MSLVYRAGRSAAEIQQQYGISDVVKLSSNELPWGPLPSVRDAILRAVTGDDGANRYPDLRATELRATIAAYHGVDPGRVAVGAGSGGILAQLVRSELRGDSAVLVPGPTFDLYRIMSTWTGASVHVADMPATVPDVDTLVAGLRPETRLVFLASPNNPTGGALGADRVARIASRVPEGCIVVVDEAYADFVTACHIDQGAALIDRYDNVVVLRTFSKAHGLAGLRIGYLLGHPAIVDRVGALSTPFHIGTVGQVAAIESVRHAAQVRERAERVVAERERMAATIRAMGLGLGWSQANFLWLPAGSGAARLAQALEQRGLVPRLFDGKGVRVTVARAADNDRVLAVLGELDLRDTWTLPVGDGVVAAARTAAELESVSGVVDGAVARDAYRAALALAGRVPDPQIDTWGAEQAGHALVAELLDVVSVDLLEGREKIAAQVIATARAKDGQ
ncbi:pyridoxal phosphate-dependent aminotransferase [Amycolatopsis pithecellobii]|nr:aminotransferase class I/II-fold pyridoxal phosphate-dependent enzyme [Amycolatopsis pithecellobii]